jgi:hypothetical protein
MGVNLIHRRTPAVLVAIAALTAPCLAQHADVLEPEHSVAGALAAGTRRAYEFPARQGDFIRVVVEQDRMDLEVRIAGTGDGSIASVENAVLEDDAVAISAIAPESGTYRLELIAGARQRTSGRYRATLTTLRAAGPGDAPPVGQLHCVSVLVRDQAHN